MALRRLRLRRRGGEHRFDMTTQEFVVKRGGDRLDLFLAGTGSGLTRSQVGRLTEEGYVLLNGSVPKAGRKLRPGDRILITVPLPRPVKLTPEDIPLNIVYQDSELLVVDKPAGLTVHPAPGHPSHTLVNALLALCPDLQGIGGEIRPGIVHRLDKDTSGLMVVAKSSGAHLGIGNQIRRRTVRKGYLALARGRVQPAEGRIDAPIGRDRGNRKRMAVVPGGREASTSYKVLRYFHGESEERAADCSYLEVFLKTGRTHQIRVHMASIGHPLVGDALYGKKSAVLATRLDRQFLHAHILGFRHPATDEYLEFSSPLPADLRSLIEALESPAPEDGPAGAASSGHQLT